MFFKKQMEEAFSLLAQALLKLHMLMLKLKPTIVYLRNIPELQEAFAYGKQAYSQLPESVSLSLTIAIVFVSSLFLLRIGRSLVSFIVFMVQIVFFVGAGYLIWKSRDMLTDWIEYLLQDQ